MVCPQGPRCAGIQTPEWRVCEPLLNPPGSPECSGSLRDVSGSHLQGKVLLSGLCKIGMHVALSLKGHISNIFVSAFEGLLSQGPEEVQFLFSVFLVENVFILWFWCQIIPHSCLFTLPCGKGRGSEGKSEKAAGLVQLL